MSSKKQRREERRRQAQKRQQQRLVLITVALIAAVGLGVYFLSGQDGSVNADRFQLDRQPWMGDPDAPVTLVEFVDFKCPHCRAFSQDILRRVEANYVDSGQVKIVLINFPFLGPDSRTAAMATEAVYRLDPSAYWEFVDRVFSAQGPMDAIWATQDLLADLAVQSSPSIDRQAFLDLLNSKSVADEVSADERIARGLGIQGTPTVYINGQRMDNLSFAALRQVIENELAAAGS